ncbi:MAG: hypothetical protein Q7T55_04985 [Solirubrobacteraceae bacterium]|nr:hypothetical protein [Solirubrobacteraceae bacterium]
MAATPAPAADGAAAPSRSRADLVSWAILLLYVAVLLLLSWKRWGNPLGDVGLDLTVASGWLDGVLPYRDVRYWYGPLGIGVLATAFAVLGSHLWVAMLVGLAQTALIAELTRRLARRWLPVPATLGVVAVVLSIGFSGTLSNFTMPHTFAATTGLIALLFALLALSHERFALAGLAVGATALSRPEFFAFGVAAVGGAAFGAWRQGGFAAALRESAKAVGTTLLVAVPVLGFFAIEAGAYRVFFENIFPLEFLRTVGATFEHDQHPFDLPSVGTLLVRGAVLAIAVWVFMAAWSIVAAHRAEERVVLPGSPVRILGGAVVAIVVGMGLAVLGGDAGQPVSLVKSDATRFIFAMTALPAVGLGMLLVAARAWLRKDASPLATDYAGPADVAADGAVDGDAVISNAPRAADSSGWVAAGALIAAAAACSLRSYAQFSTDVYGTYYAAPVVVLAGILLYRLVAARPSIQGGRLAVPVVFALAAATLSAHAYLGLYRDFSKEVTTPNGSFIADAAAGDNMNAAFRRLAELGVQPGERIVAMPQEPGFYFLTGARPALYDSTFLPGVLATREDDEAAADALLTGEGVPRQARPVDGETYVPPRLVIETNWNFALWGFDRQGVDVNRALHRAVVDNYDVVGRFGDTQTLPPKLSLGRAFTIYELR